MIGAARAYADERRWHSSAANRRYGASYQDKALRGQKHNCGVAVLVVGRILRVLMTVGRTMGVMMVVGHIASIVVMRPALVAGAELHVARKGIGEMRVMVSVVDAVDQ
jgi:hypothetical protein